MAKNWFFPLSLDGRDFPLLLFSRTLHRQSSVVHSGGARVICIPFVHFMIRGIYDASIERCVDGQTLHERPSDERTAGIYASKDLLPYGRRMREG